MRSEKEPDMSTTPSRYAQAMADPNRPMCPNGCQRRIWAGGVCAVCYRMIRLYGVAKTDRRDPEAIRQRRIKFLWDNIDVRGPDDCWPWKRKPTSGGYGQLRWFSGQIHAHVAVFEVTYGPTPPETPFHDHTCHDPKSCDLLNDCPHRACCNPAHIKAVTRAENQSKDRSRSRRPDNGGSSPCPPNCTCKRHEDQKCKPGCTCRRHKGNQDSCVNGHEYTPETLYTDSKGWRHCNECRRERRARDREARR
jgi:hypothetical protein